MYGDDDNKANSVAADDSGAPLHVPTISDGSDMTQLNTTHTQSLCLSLSLAVSLSFSFRKFTGEEDKTVGVLALGFGISPPWDRQTKAEQNGRKIAELFEERRSRVDRCFDGFDGFDKTYFFVPSNAVTTNSQNTNKKTISLLEIIGCTSR